MSDWRIDFTKPMEIDAKALRDFARHNSANVGEVDPNPIPILVPVIKYPIFTAPNVAPGSPTIEQLIRSNGTIARPIPIAPLQSTYPSPTAINPSLNKATASVMPQNWRNYVKYGVLATVTYSLYTIWKS